MNSKDKGVVSVLSLAASAIALICFVTGRSTLSDFVSPHTASPSPSSAPGSAPASPAPVAQTEQTLTQAAFFVHYGHPPGRGGDDYDPDDRESDRQKLVGALETYVAAAQSLPQERSRLARAQALLHQLSKVRSPAAG